MRNIIGDRFEINSGYEASVIGRAATHGKSDTTASVPISHSAELPPTYDEVEFLERGLAYGREPVVSKDIAQAALGGLRAIVASQKVYRSIRPEEAAQFLAVIGESEPAQPTKPVQLSEEELEMLILANYPTELLPSAPGLSSVDSPAAQRPAGQECQILEFPPTTRHSQDAA